MDVEALVEWKPDLYQDSNYCSTPFFYKIQTLGIGEFVFWKRIRNRELLKKDKSWGFWWGRFVFATCTRLCACQVGGFSFHCLALCLATMVALAVACKLDSARSCLIGTPFFWRLLWPQLERFLFSPYVPKPHTCWCIDYVGIRVVQGVMKADSDWCVHVYI